MHEDLTARVQSLVNERLDILKVLYDIFRRGVRDIQYEIPVPRTCAGESWKYVGLMCHCISVLQITSVVLMLQKNVSRKIINTFFFFLVKGTDIKYIL